MGKLWAKEQKLLEKFNLPTKTKKRLLNKKKTTIEILWVYKMSLYYNDCPLGAIQLMGDKYHRIRVATPRHNGKVERQHRTDEKRFYKKMRMYSLEDGRKQLEKYNVKSNNIPKICLNFLSPNEVMDKYLTVM